MKVIVPSKGAFERIKGNMRDGMQMRCPGSCKCSCTSCGSCRCTPCRHAIGATVITR